MCPGNSVRCSDFDGEIVATSSLNMDLSDCNLKMGKGFKPFSKQEVLTPSLRTAMPEKRVSSFQESVLALKKRNLAAPRLQESVNELELVEKTVFKAMNTLFNTELIDLTPLCTYESVQRWWQKQSPKAQSEMLKDPRMVDQIDFTTYNFMIKNDVKPKLDCSPQHEYSALQTIVYPDKLVNAYFGHVMKEINERMLKALHPWFVVNARMTAAELDEKVSFLPLDLDMDSIEIDISKYDKSKTGLHIGAVIALYEKFGLTGELMHYWIQSQWQTNAKDRNTGVEAFILFQQKSGNVDTYFSNTWCAVLALLDCLPLERAIFSIFGGDDSLILYPKGEIISDPCSRLQNLWNFECKLLSMDHPLFCGKFLLRVGARWRFVPDARKLIEKLGKKDIPRVGADKLLSEIFVSINDNYGCYDDMRVLHALDEAIIERYKPKYSSLAALISVRKFLSNFDNFRLLFSYKGKFVKTSVRKDYEW